MKRIGNLYDKIISLDNLRLADKIARKGKNNQYGVQKHILNAEENLLSLHELLNHRKFETSEYSKFEILEPKHRTIARLPYFPDRVVHHAILIQTKDVFVKTFISTTYSGIKGRGIHKASHDLRKALQDDSHNKYCLKLDIRKFYESIDHDILKSLLRKKFKDTNLLNLFDEIIDSNEVGLPLGSLVSQYLANYYLAYFDHYLKEQLKIRFLFRYMDDVVILSNNKEELHYYLAEIKEYLKTLKLEVKGNYQVSPVDKRGIDFVGFRHYTTHTLLRRTIKQNFIKSKNRERWNGWLKNCNSINLRRKYK